MTKDKATGMFADYTFEQVIKISTYENCLRVKVDGVCKNI